MMDKAVRRLSNLTTWGLPIDNYHTGTTNFQYYENQQPFNQTTTFLET